MMTQELYEKLSKYENIFRTAIDACYYRAMTSVFAADFINGCKELGVYINTSCPACVLKALLTVGKLYFDYRQPEQPASPETPDLSEGHQKYEDNKTIKTKKKASQTKKKSK